jgi:hypothetical protein
LRKTRKGRPTQAKTLLQTESDHENKQTHNKDPAIRAISTSS